MDDILLHVDHADPLQVLTDVLAVQYPQRLLGVVERVVDAAVAAGRHVLLPQPGDDAPDAAGRLYDSLAAAFGSERFMDIDSVPLGINFVTHINNQLHGCAAVLIMIGRSWTASTDAEGNRRLEDPLTMFAWRWRRP